MGAREVESWICVGNGAVGALRDHVVEELTRFLGECHKGDEVRDASRGRSAGILVWVGERFTGFGHLEALLVSGEICKSLISSLDNGIAFR